MSPEEHARAVTPPAYGPNQIRVRDITWLPGPVAGTDYHR